MYLTREEERILLGERGEAARIAMEVLVKVGEALGSQRLVEVTHAHISGISYFNIGEEGLEFLEYIKSLGAKASIFTTANPASLVGLWEREGDHEVKEKQRRIMDLIIGMGVDPRSFTCAPYKLRRPNPREHLAWAESSAVIYANSVLGAKTNRESGITALMSALVGRTYCAGMHIDEERCPTEDIVVSFDITTIAEASVLGLYVGRVTKGIPYIKARFRVEDPSLQDLLIRNMLASIATTSDCALAVIDGLTPPYAYVEKNEPRERVEVDREELASYAECFCPVALLGCPHVTPEELLLVVRSLRKAAARLPILHLIVTLPKEVGAEKYVDDVTREVSKMGISLTIVRGGCAVVTDLKRYNFGCVSTPHGKAYHYLPLLAGVKACLMRFV